MRKTLEIIQLFSTFPNNIPWDIKLDCVVMSLDCQFDRVSGATSGKVAIKGWPRANLLVVMSVQEGLHC